MLWSIQTGAKVPPQSTPGICENPLLVDSTLVGTVHLNHLVPTILSPAGTEVTGTRLKTPCLSRLAISLSDTAFQRIAWGRPMVSLKVFTAFQRIAWGRPMVSLKVFGIRSDSLPPGQRGCVLVMV